MAWNRLKTLTITGLLTMSAGVFEMQINSGKIMAQDIDIFRNPDVDIMTNPNGQSRNYTFMGSLNGQWHFRYADNPKGWETPITQNGNRLEMLQNFDFSMQKVEGTISGNQIRVNFMGRNGGLVGTISADGNTIKGELLPLPSSSNRQPLQFIMQRIQANSPIARPPSNAPNSSIAEEMLNAHNKWRSQVGVPPLRWSNQLANYAQEWATNLAQTGRFEHRQNSAYGENIFMGRGSSWSPTQVVDDWGSEIKDYNYASNTCGGVCGHYTQIVWKTTTEVGCGVGRSGDKEIWVCNYNPPGNYVGRKPY